MNTQDAEDFDRGNYLWCHADIWISQGI